MIVVVVVVVAEVDAAYNGLGFSESEELPARLEYSGIQTEQQTQYN